MFLFKLNSNQFAISYFYPGFFQRKNGTISLFESRTAFKIFSLFLCLDLLFIGLIFYFSGENNSISMLTVIYIQISAFFIRNYLLSKHKIRIPIDKLNIYFLAPPFYWISHILMGSSIIYSLYMLINNHHILNMSISLIYIFNVLQIIFSLILISPMVNVSLIKFRNLMKLL